MTVEDHEVLRELRDQPELLAVADALNDVLPRSMSIEGGRSGWWTRKISIAAICVAVIAATVGALFAVQSSGGGGLDRISNHGALVTSASIEVGQHFGKRSPRGTYLLGVLENQAFYRVETNEGTCYANGPAGKTLGGYCPVNPPFPSPSRPVLAAASVSADKAHRATILGFAGFAADGVARVDFVGKDGYTTSAAIHNNIFNLKVAGQLLNGSKLVFKDRSGKTVYTQQN